MSQAIGDILKVTLHNRKYSTDQKKPSGSESFASKNLSAHDYLLPAASIIIRSLAHPQTFENPYPQHPCDYI